jgi:hypothetical protein
MRRLLILVAALSLLAVSCGDDSDTGGIESELASLVSAAEDVRGLTFFEEPLIVIVSTDELADRIRVQIEEELDPEETLTTQRLYELLGLLDGSVDLLQAYTDLYAEAVGGYYDDETGEMVISGDDALRPLAKTIVVHELIHALTDQHFGFASKLDDLIDEERYQEAAALQALAEGDATYFQLVYMQTLPTSEQVEAVQESLGVDTTVADSLPAWFSEDLTWPYDSGFDFVDRVISDLGVSGLNQTYTLLPTTSEHIMHPGSYFTRQPPRSVTLPDASLEGYELIDDGPWGEWNLQLLLLDGVDPGEAIVAATGWGGDDYAVYANETELAFAYLYQADTPRDAEEMATSLASSVRQRMGVGAGLSTPTGTTFSPGDDFALIVRDDKRVLFIAASDPLTGSNLAGQLRSSVSSG